MTGNIEALHKPAWLTWETQRRNKELSERFGADYLRFDYSVDNRIVRYAKSFWRTIPALVSRKVVFVQCPSLLLMLAAAVARRLRRMILIIDAHNAAFEAARRFPFGTLVRFCFSTADFVIVSNQALSTQVREFGGRPLVLPDPLPEIPARPRPAILDGRRPPFITLISTFAADEPIEAFINGALALSQTFTLFVTGRKEKAGRLAEFESDKIRFTGFLPEAEFEALIRSSDLLVDLTTREDCLVCGAYEALAVSVPVLLSDTKALRACFGSAAIYSANTAEAFTDALRFYLSESDRIRSAVPRGKQEFLGRWHEQFSAAEREILQKL